MAVMWPRNLPRSIRDDSRRRAEVRVYDKLAEALDNNFHVFYSSPWLGIDNLGNEKDGECDFLIAHSEHGILAIEVKGGEITFEPQENLWTSKDAQGFVHKIKNPIEQARSAKYEILKRLNQSKMWKSRHIHISHGVIFPNASSAPQNLGPDRPADIFCCSRQFSLKMRDWVSARMSEHNRPKNCSALGKDGIIALETLLAKPFTLSFKIGSALSEAEEEFRILEPSQYHILDTIADISRVAIRGGAGTGKTIVAIEEAIRSASKGLNTLLTCYNSPLAKHLEKKLNSVKNLTVASFHSLCGRAASVAGISIPANINQALYEKNLPDALYDALEAKPSLKWDTVIVDEGQDFRPEWWIAIDSCLKNHGVLRIFIDSNQKVYEHAELRVQDLSTVPIRLSRNLRNTRKIHDAASLYYLGHEITADGPDGVAVSWVKAESPQAKIDIAFNELRRLIFNEEVFPGDVAVLVNGQAEKLNFLEKSAGTSIPITDAETLALEDTVVDTVRRFKGLERPVIILITSGDDMERTELSYIAFTRARAYLCVVCSSAEYDYLLKGS